MTRDREVFRALADAIDKADAHPESDLLQRRANQLMAGWITQLQQHAAADLSGSERLREETQTAAAIVSEVATREGAQALEAGELAEAASRWRVAAVLEDRDTAELLAQALGQQPVMLKLIKLYVQLNQPHLALAWCTIAAGDGWPIAQIHPLMHRAWQMLSPES